jgi:hypothetical protein
LEILFQRFGRLALLQQLFRALDAPGYFGSVQAFCDLRHE